MGKIPISWLEVGKCHGGIQENYREKGRVLPGLGWEWWQEVTIPKVHTSQNSQFLKLIIPKIPSSLKFTIPKVHHF